MKSKKRIAAASLCFLFCLLFLMTGCDSGNQVEETKKTGQADGRPEQEMFLADFAASLSFDFLQGTFSYTLPKTPSGYEYSVESYVEWKDGIEGEPAVQTQAGDSCIVQMGNWADMTDCSITVKLSPIGADNSRKWQEKTYQATFRASACFATQYPYFVQGETEKSPKKYGDWRSAYKDVIETMYDGYAGTSTVGGYLLYNVDKKGAPELFLGNGEKAYVFSFSDGVISYLGDTHGTLFEAKGKEENDFYSYGIFQEEESGAVHYAADYYRMDGDVICICDDRFFAEGIADRRDTKLKKFRLNGKKVDEGVFEDALKEKMKFSTPLTFTVFDENGLDDLVYGLAGATPTGKITMSVAKQRADMYFQSYQNGVVPKRNTKLYGDMPWADWTGYTPVSFSLISDNDYETRIFYTLKGADANYYVMAEELKYENHGQTWIREDWSVQDWRQSEIVILDEKGDTEGELLPNEENEK